jgi:uncharacterized membrane protein YecN with MAPEG domain
VCLYRFQSKIIKYLMLRIITTNITILKLCGCTSSEARLLKIFGYVSQYTLPFRVHSVFVQLWNNIIDDHPLHIKSHSLPLIWSLVCLYRFQSKIIKVLLLRIITTNITILKLCGCTSLEARLLKIFGYVSQYMLPIRVHGVFVQLWKIRLLKIIRYEARCMLPFKVQCVCI